MGIEIERKFLVNVEAFLNADASTQVRHRSMMTQGYIANDPWVRVRIADGGQAWITIKGQGAPVSPEWEFPIPASEAHDLYEKVCKNKLTKIRRKVSFQGHTWDVDEFLGPLQSFWLAEIELKTLDEPFVRPPWVTQEVTGDPRYSNGWIAEHGIPT